MTKSQKARSAIRSARNESQVIAAVRDYLDSLDASDAAVLPGELLALGLVPAEELIQTALHALHEVSRADAKGGVARETALVFSAAARRLAALAQ
jgi:hypothetical protein